MYKRKIVFTRLLDHSPYPWSSRTAVVSAVVSLEGLNLPRLTSSITNPSSTSNTPKGYRICKQQRQEQRQEQQQHQQHQQQEQEQEQEQEQQQEQQQERRRRQQQQQRRRWRRRQQRQAAIKGRTVGR